MARVHLGGILKVEAMVVKNFSGTEFENKAPGFDKPTQLPRDEAERRNWQLANKTWWESTPMRYDWREEITADLGSEAYFDEIDRRFLSSAHKYMPWRKEPFDEIIPFEQLRDKDVLEYRGGFGYTCTTIGAMVQIVHRNRFDLPCCRSDVTTFQASKYRRQNSPDGCGAMEFADNSFDYIWTWGVIHHSADTRSILKEMNRVLRPGGKCAVMVYYRSWWTFYVCGLLRGVFKQQFKKRGGLHRVAQIATDGAIARYYTRREWAHTAGDSIST